MAESYTDRESGKIDSNTHRLPLTNKGRPQAAFVATSLMSRDESQGIV